MWVASKLNRCARWQTLTEIAAAKASADDTVTQLKDKICEQLGHALSGLPVRIYLLAVFLVDTCNYHRVGSDITEVGFEQLGTSWGERQSQTAGQMQSASQPLLLEGPTTDPWPKACCKCYLHSLCLLQVRQVCSRFGRSSQGGWTGPLL